jgi:geranylgeranyl diphosphate synthase type I
MARGPVRFPVELGAVATRAEARIAVLLDAERRRWVAVDALLADPLDALRDLVLAGGKRLRPAFCAAGFVAADGELDNELLTDAGAALELLHTFALVHDDVMDGSETRRGLEAVHRRFHNDHERAGWRGEARRFGEGMAILVGDFAFVLADVLLRSSGPSVEPLWDELRLELCVGQSLDLSGAVRRSTDLALANRIARYKSAKYTVERPLHLGAALAGRYGDLAAPLSAIGLPLGAAFQLRDDVLGVFGEAVITGKPVGDDLREGKPTPLLALAADAAAGLQIALLERVGADDLDDTEIKELQELIITTGALQAVEHEIDRLVAEAHDAIAAAPISAHSSALLSELSDYVAWRDH